jgi:hypothetical protein
VAILINFSVIMPRLSVVSFTIKNTGNTALLVIAEDSSENPISPEQSITYTKTAIYKVFILNDSDMVTLFAITWSDTGIDISNGDVVDSTTAKAEVTVEME